MQFQLSTQFINSDRNCLFIFQYLALNKENSLHSNLMQLQTIQMNTNVCHNYKSKITSIQSYNSNKKRFPNYYNRNYNHKNTKPYSLIIYYQNY